MPLLPRVIVRPHGSAHEGKYGYARGGAVTQQTNKGTAVALDRLTGEITMNGAALGADTTVSFTLNNVTIEAGDLVHVQHVSVGALGSYLVTAGPAVAGSVVVAVRNVTAGILSEAIVLKFRVLKAPTA